MNEAVGLREIFNIIKKEYLIIIIITTFMVFLGAAISYFMPPVYQAKTDLLVNFKAEGVESKDISTVEIETNLRLIETYKYILNSTRIMEKVAEKTGSKEKPEQLAKKIEVISNSDSQVITLKVEASSQKQAVKLANSTAEIFKTEIKSLMKIDNVDILTGAKIVNKGRPVKPDPVIYMVIFLCIGVFLSFIIIFLKETIFTKFDSQEKIEQAFKLPSLGVIPVISDKPKRSNGLFDREDRFNKMLPQLNPYSAVTEAYRAVRTNVQYTISQEDAQTILITSSHPGEGKSLTAANLAICLAMDHMETIFVDLDLRKGVGRQLFHIPLRKGVTTYLEGMATIEEIIVKTNVSNLSFIGTGPLSANPAELLSSEKIDIMLETLQESYDLVIIDTPPLVVSDAVVLSTKVDGCIFIVNAQKTKVDQTVKSIQKLKKVEANILGVVLNSGKESKRTSYYY
ncbi:hypothetical protein CD798_03260 [Bacillaceae bacterium SAOS 7]|nr:hypothetical protein CD798_03260 [Bacillaceae bacterium SAOS 7]